MSNLLMISIKQKYVEEILSGRKTIELRKSLPNVKLGDTVIIYTIQPVKAVTAVAIVGKVFSCAPSTMWRKYRASIGISKREFDEYYLNCPKAIGIELLNVTKLDAEILLSVIKLYNPKFSPPQTFKYLNKFASFRIFNALAGR